MPRPRKPRPHLATRLLRLAAATLLAAATCPLAAPAQVAAPASPPPRSIELLREEETALQAAAARAQASVVQIETFGGRQIVDDTAVAEGPTTGTVVASDGWIVTSSYQFRNDPASITVVLPGGQRKAASVVARDHSRELVLLKVDVIEPLTPATPASRESMRVGQWTVALGKTFDPDVASQSVGILSATRRIWDKAIQTDAKISPFNYGGPLIDLRGDTLGILTPIDPGIATEGEVQQWYDSGIGFAIPLEDVLERLPKLQQGEDIRRGLIGFRAAGRDDFSRRVKVAGVIPGTPISEAGVQPGDLIRSVGGRAVQYVNQLRHLLGPVDAGEAVELVVERDGRPIETRVTAVAELPTYYRPYIGLLFAAEADAPSGEGTTGEATEDAADQSEATQNQSGVVICGVAEGGPAAAAGLQVGDVLLRYNDKSMADEDAFEAALEFTDYRRPVTLHIRRGGTDELDIQVALRTWPASDELPPVTAEMLRATAADQVDAAKADEAKADEAEDAAAAAAENVAEGGLVELPFTDLPNTVLAYSPPTAPGDRVGLLLIAAEPGEKVERDKLTDAWQSFCREGGWVVCAVSPASEQKWEEDEGEIFGRAVAYVRENYPLDDRRVVLAGVQAGGRLAVIQALENREDYRAVYYGGEQIFRAAAVDAAEPQAAVDMAFGSDADPINEFAEAMRDKGYRCQQVAGPTSLLTPAAAAEAEELRRFLSTLAWY